MLMLCEHTINIHVQAFIWSWGLCQGLFLLYDFNNLVGFSFTLKLVWIICVSGQISLAPGKLQRRHETWVYRWFMILGKCFVYLSLANHHHVERHDPQNGMLIKFSMRIRLRRNRPWNRPRKRPPKKTPIAFCPSAPMQPGAGEKSPGSSVCSWENPANIKA